MEWIASVSPLEWLGYAASAVVAISLALSSVVKFRIVNLLGAAMFSAYGFIIGATPVGVMNGLIVLVDAFYLFKIFTAKDTFEVMAVAPKDPLLQRFIEYHQRDIKRFFPDYHFFPQHDTLTFLVLRNMEIAGVFAGSFDNNGCLNVSIDYVIPRLRDFKNGQYVYGHLGKQLSSSGVTAIIARPATKSHHKYLRRMGFEPVAEMEYLKKMIL